MRIPRIHTPQALHLGATLALDEDAANHVGRVLRMQPGDALILFNGDGQDYTAQIHQVSKRGVDVVLTSAKPNGRESPLQILLGQVISKGDRMDYAVQKATELGVRRIQPVLTRRCVADKLNLERARTIVTEAAEQCARTALPEIAGPLTLEALLRAWPGDRTLFFADETGGEPAAAQFAAHSGAAALLIGPEGGFDDAERAMIRSHPRARAITLGPRILRGETASIAATALWMACAGDWTGPVR